MVLQGRAHSGRLRRARAVRILCLAIALAAAGCGRESASDAASEPFWTERQSEDSRDADAHSPLAKMARHSSLGVVGVERAGEAASSGRFAHASGFVISEDGWVVTADSVALRAERVRVLLDDGRELEARVHGRSPESGIALLRIEEPRDLQPLPLGSTKALWLGDWLVAIGRSRESVQIGVGVLRSLVSVREPGVGEADAAAAQPQFVETDAATAGGCAGGPILDGTGQVVAICLDGAPDRLGRTRALAIDVAKRRLLQMRADAAGAGGWLGARVQALDEALSRAFGIEEVGYGVVVTKVDRAGPAAAAGLRPGDVILAVDGERVHDPQELRARLMDIAPDRAIPLELVRDGERSTLEVPASGRGRAPAGAGPNGYAALIHRRRSP